MLEKTDFKKFLIFEMVAEAVSVCIVYVVVLYFLISEERAFAMWNNTTDIIFSSILRVLGLAILPIMLILYLSTKIKQRKNRWLYPYG